MTGLADRFNGKWEPITESGCWVWKDHLMHKGYGVISINGKPKRAHRVSYELHKGEITNNLHVLHKCDVRCCVNPDHLFLGTNADNMRDRDAKGRAAKGVSHGLAKLSTEDVNAIRCDNRTQQEIASEYNVSRGHISDIKLYKKRII